MNLHRQTRRGVWKSAVKTTTAAVLAAQLLFLPDFALSFTQLSCKGLCGSFAPNRDCFCDGFCVTKGDCCDDFEDECDENVLACVDNDACLLSHGGPPSCTTFALAGESCSSQPNLAKCCAVSCGLCRDRVQGATLARRLAGNGGSDVCVDEGALVCPNACSGNGDCDYSSGVCSCYTGWGATSDIALYKAADCSQRTCPAGPAWTALATAADQAHTLAECSNRGHCDRSTGECQCKDGYTGDACQRTKCFNDCSGRGTCVSMRTLAGVGELAEPRNISVSYGDEAADSAWDAEQIFGCLCSSSWDVGLEDGETQASEFFGPDCSLRRCPSGDDPGTRTVTETDCEGVNGGQAGNLCHVDCSNRGTCDYASGTCSCTDGYTGLNCGIKIEFG